MLSCRVTCGRAILADQGSETTIELQQYTQYLSGELLWELGHAIRNKARYVNLSGWTTMTTVRRTGRGGWMLHVACTQGSRWTSEPPGILQVSLRSFSLAMGDKLVGLNLSRTNATTDPLQFSSIRFFALASLNLSHSSAVRGAKVAGAPLRVVRQSLTLLAIDTVSGRDWSGCGPNCCGDHRRMSAHSDQHQPVPLRQHFP